jgi:hypothetical protein
MAYIDDLHNALIKADAAGDTEAARALANEIRAQGTQEPQSQSLVEKVTKGPAKAGFMNLAASLAGLPVDTAQNVYNLAKAGVGVATGRPQDFPLVEGTPGGSESIRKLLAKSPYTSTENPNPESGVGTAAYDLASRGVGVPGMSLAGLSAYAAGKTLGPQYEPLAAMVPSAVRQSINELRQPAREAAQLRNIERDKTLKDAQELGLKAIPSSVEPTFVGNRLESIAGKAALKQQLSIDNSEAVYNIAKREAGLPDNAPLNEGTLKTARDQMAEPYRQIAALSPRASNALDGLKQARFMAKHYWSFFDRQGDPAAMLKAKDYDNRAGLFERVMENEAARHGESNLIPELKKARTAIAKNYTVDRAFNPGDGTVDARIIGRAYDSGTKMTGDLETLAKFALGPGKQVIRPSTVVPNPGTSALEATAAAGFGLGGAAAFGPVGAAAGFLPFIRPAVRNALASKAYQNTMVKPDYMPLSVDSLPSTIQAAILANRNAQGNVPLSGILPKPTQDSMVPLSDLARH